MQKTIKQYRDVTLLLLTLFLCAITGFRVAFAQNNNEYAIEVETEGSYRLQPGDPVHLGRMVAFYEAKKNAVEMAARYFIRKGFIEISDTDKQEVFSLSIAGIEAKELKSHQFHDGPVKTYRVLIRARVRVVDFVLAERLEKKLANEAKRNSFLEKMEPVIGPEIDPGQDIAKAYRLIREKQWRQVVIYLDQLEKKYPGWGEIQATKALAQYSLNEPGEVKLSLNRACRLGNEGACKELKELKKLHDYDFNTDAHQ
ncbi:MAG: hypothetical protein Q8P24_16880 [Desulfobacterales bacterium]|nr:hypothetical protein [Desulfobacterales bacterium]